MESQEEMFTSAQLGGINARHLAVLYEEIHLVDEFDNEKAQELLSEISDELDIEFEDRRQAEFAFIMMAEAYQLGKQ